MKLLIIGPQGSGKGTQAQLISKKLQIPHISTGDLFRELQGELKQEVNNYMNQGKLVPDELTIKILKQRLEQPDTEKGFILDGFPRNLNQTELLKQITDIDKVIEIDISDELAIKRITGRRLCKNCNINYNLITEPKPKNPSKCDKCQSPLIQRPDDTEEAVKKRLQTYHQETEPILNIYKNKIIKVNGEQSIEDVDKEIMEKLKI